MPIPVKSLSHLLASLLLSAPVWAQPLKASVNYIPPFTNTGGKQTIWYELSFVNPGISPIKLQKIDILDSARNIMALTLDTAAISTRLASKTRRTSTSTGTMIPAGDTMALYIELTSALVKPATKLIHEIKYDYQPADSARTQTKIVPLKISIIPPVAETLVLGPPLKGGPWAAIFSPDWASGHRRVYYKVDGVSRLPGRFAIDFMKLDTSGHFVHGDSDKVNNYYGYGMEVLAVADGVVAATRTDMNESPTISGHPDYSPDSATGNYISIEIGRDQFAFYEHLKPGSIKVKQGQEVKKGQVIALVGFTGQSTGPHLHFHIADINSPLGAEGIPYVFERYNLLGTYPDFSKFGNRPWTIAPEEKKVRTSEKPASNSVVSF